MCRTLPSDIAGRDQMTSRVAISAVPGELRTAWLDNNDHLRGLTIQRDGQAACADNLYLGRVASLDKSLDAAFVDIGQARPGFLPRGEGPKGLSAGDSLVVRVKRDPLEDEGARLTALRLALSTDLTQKAAAATPPTLLHDAADPLIALRDNDDIPGEIVVDDEIWHARARNIFAQRPELLACLRLDLAPQGLFERLGLETEIDTLLQAQVALPSGGTLLIEPVRTLTAIDVNAARHGAGGAGGQAMAVNLEAAAKIPELLRLRNLSGLIVIDFLTLKDSKARQKITELLKQGCRDDPNPVRIQAMRPSGLLEMTRRRARPPLHEILCETWHLGGPIKSAETLGYEALRHLRAAATGKPLRRFALRAAPPIAAALAGPCAAARAALEARLDRALEIEIDAGQDSFQIVLE